MMTPTAISLGRISSWSVRGRAFTIRASRSPSEEAEAVSLLIVINLKYYTRADISDCI